MSMVERIYEIKEALTNNGSPGQSIRAALVEAEKVDTLLSRLLTEGRIAQDRFNEAQVAWHTADTLGESYNLTDEQWKVALDAQVEAIKLLRQYFGEVKP